MVNILFVLIFIIGFVYAVFAGRVDTVVEVLLSTPKDSLFIFIDIYALLIFWGGMLEICKQSGLLGHITRAMSYVLHPLFKRLDVKSDAMQYISMNFVSNMLSMGSVATPFGLKAMQELNRLNQNQTVASDEMITFLLINTSGLCFLPTTLISLRPQAGSDNPVAIIPYIIIVSCITTVFSILMDIGVRRHGKH